MHFEFHVNDRKDVTIQIPPSSTLVQQKTVRIDVEDHEVRLSVYTMLNQQTKRKINVSVAKIFWKQYFKWLRVTIMMGEYVETPISDWEKLCRIRFQY